MVRKLAAQVLVVVVAVVASVVALASPAMAFTKDVWCYNQNGSAWQQTSFVADNGDPLGHVVWYWKWPGQGSDKYMLSIQDDAPYDGAVTVLRVDLGSTVKQYYQDADDANGYLVLTSTVRKYRAVWNGYATNWITPNACLWDV